MTILSILITLKTLLFIKATHIEYNALVILFISLGVSLFIVSSVGMSKLKSKKIILTLFYIFISAVMLVDVVHYTYFNSLPSVKMLSQAGQLTDVSDSVKSLLNLKNLFFVIDIPFVIYYIFKINKDMEREFNKTTRIAVPSALLIITITLFTIININGQINSIKLQEIYTFHFTDIKDALSKEEELTTLEGNTIFTQEDLDELKERARLKEGRFTGLGKERNLIVIQVEALQSFVVDLVYNGQEITPNINKLIHDSSSLYYDNYYQLLGRGNTADAEFVSNNSLHPSMETPTYDQYEENTFYGLPWVLRDNGYTPWAFHGYKKEFWNRDKAYVNQGFQRFISEEDYEFEETIGLGITDKDFFHQTIDYLKELDSIDENPFYAFIVTLTSHNPFDMPEEYHVLDIKAGHKNTILGNYLQSIHYTDKYIGEFIEELKREGLYDNSVIALYGDHFAIQNTTVEIHEIMEGFLGHKYDYDDIMNIPLVIHIPGEELGETISKVGSQIDFFPTILNIMGYDNSKGIIFGRDLNNYEGYTNVTPQTIMRKGSFVDENIIFEISRTEIFDHSRARDINTKEELDIQQFRPIYERAIEEINKSNFILKHDIIKHLIENNGQLDFGQIQDNTVRNKEYIKKIKFNSEEDLVENYNQGHKIMAVDISMGSEEKVVLTNNWDSSNEKTEMTMEDLASWKELYNDTHILFRTKEEDKEKLYEKIKYQHPKARTEDIVEIKKFSEHYFITSYGYENILLNIVDEDYTDDEILDFLKVHQLFGIILDEERTKTDLVNKVKELGIDIYMENEEAIEATH